MTQIPPFTAHPKLRLQSSPGPTPESTTCVNSLQRLDSYNVQLDGSSKQKAHYISASRDLIYGTKMSVQLPPPTHRKRALPQGELEAASTLRLGADQNTHTLSLSEARLVINKVLENKRRGGKKYEEPE